MVGGLGGFGVGTVTAPSFRGLSNNIISAGQQECDACVVKTSDYVTQVHLQSRLFIQSPPFCILWQPMYKTEGEIKRVD